MSADISFASSNFTAIVALDCDVNPRADVPCSSTGSMAIPRDLAPTDPILSLTAASSTSSGSGYFHVEGLSRPRCEDLSASDSSIFDAVVVYGLSQQPVTVELPGGTPRNVTNDFSDKAFYEADLQRMQVTAVGLDFCDENKLTMSWNF